MQTNINAFEKWLRKEEKQPATIEKYLRDVKAFCAFLGSHPVTKELIMTYKSALSDKYKPAGVNGRLAAVNRFLSFLGYNDCCVKLLKVQRQAFSQAGRELTTEEYQRLIRAAGDSRISYILQTICGTGIRVSELKYVTAEAVLDSKAIVDCKGKTRTIFFTAQLRSVLLKYMKRTGIKRGCLFITRNGKPVDRTSVWREMKALCKRARVSPAKVYPHNLRHLFARTFYSMEKDIARLADLLGHSSIETTRIYTVESGRVHLQKLERVSKKLFAT